MLRRIGVTAISAWAAHGLAWGAGLWMALGPVYQGVSGTPTTPGESATYATRYTATLVEQNGLWVFWLLLVPIMLSALALLTIALTDAGQARRKALLWLPAIVLLASALWEYSPSGCSTYRRRWLYCAQPSLAPWGRPLAFESRTTLLVSDAVAAVRVQLGTTRR